MPFQNLSHANFRLKQTIMLLWVVGCLVVAASSQLNVDNFERNEESRLLSMLQPPQQFERAEISQVNKKPSLKSYAWRNHILYGKRYNNKLTLPIVSDESFAVDLDNIKQSEGVTGYLDSMKQIVPNAAAAIYNSQDPEEEEVDNDYDNFKIQLSDGRLDDDGRIFFNIDGSHNTI